MKVFAFFTILLLQVSGEAWTYSIRHQNCNLEVRLGNSDHNTALIEILKAKNYNVIQKGIERATEGDLFMSMVWGSYFNVIPIPGIYGEHDYWDITINEAGKGLFDYTEITRLTHTIRYSGEDQALEAVKKVPECEKIH